MRKMPKKVLIVEDEVLIARSIASFLDKHDYIVTGLCISMDDVKASIPHDVPDIALLDIRISGDEDGIDVARYINEYYPETIIIFLTSQYDVQTLKAASEVRSDGYITKPIQYTTLFATMEMTLAQRTPLDLTLSSSTEVYKIPYKEILYIEADHVYIRIHRLAKTPLLYRMSLSEIEDRLPRDQFLRIHRSTIINKEHAKEVHHSTVLVGDTTLKVSRSYQQEVRRRLLS